MGVFLLGLCITAAGSLWLRAQTEAQALGDFQRSVDRVADEVGRRMHLPLYGMKGAAAMRAANQRLDRATFRAYVASHPLARDFPGVRGFGFIERVERGALDAFVAAERADGAPQFAIRQLNDAALPDLYVIKYIEPAAGNQGAMGLDVGSESVRRAAAELAVRSGEATLSGPITLVQDEQRTPGFLLFLPLLGDSPGGPALLGLFYAPIVAAEMLQGVSEVHNGLVDFSLSDQPGVPAGAAPATSLVFDSLVSSAELASRAASPVNAARYQATRKLALPGRELTLQVRSTPQFEAAVPQGPVRVGMILGALLSLLLAAFVRQQQTSRRRAEAHAGEMTTELARLALVAQRTSNAVIITDRELRITWVNDAFTRLYGHSAAQALGFTPGALLGSGKSAPEALQTLRAAAASGTGCRVELVNRARDGHEIFIDTEVQPTFDTEGRLTGYIEIASDISARRAADSRIAGLIRENEALLGTIREHAIVSVADADGAIIEVNDAFCRISGHEREALLGQDHHIVNSGIQLPSFWAAMWAQLSAGKPWRGQVCNRSRDGQLYWVDSVIAPFVGADGRIEKYVSLSTDITASKHAERELARGRQRLSNIIDGTNVGTWEWNVVTGETVFNARWAQIIGFTLDELGATSIETWSRHSHPEDLLRSTQLLERHFNGETPAYECEARMRHRDGHWVWVLDRGKVFSRDAQGRPRWMAGTHMDITERKQAEAALQASQTLLDRTGRIGGVGGWELDLATHAMHWTDEACRIHEVAPGYRPTLEESIAAYAPDARPLIAQAVAQAQADGRGWDLELPFVTTRGRPIWVRTVGEAEFADGRPVRLVGALQDVTARRALQADLRAKNALVTSVLDNLPCGLSVFDSDLNLVVANAEFRRLLDLPDSLFGDAGTRYEDIIRFNAQRGEYGAVDVDARVQAMNELARSPTAHRFERERPGGITLEIQGAPMPGGGFVTTYTDISARRRAQAEVKRGAELLRGAIDAIDEAFVLYDPDDRLVFCNEKYRQTYPTVAHLMVPGASFEQIVRFGAERGDYGDAIGRVDAWLAERLAAHRAANTTLVQKLASGRTLRIVERKMPDGHIVGFRIDITELVHASEAAQKASLAKSQFLANMSHEIRTPMNAILGMLALLRKTALTARQAEYAAKTEGAARSLLGLLNDILDFSKVEAGKMTLDPHPFRIDQLLRDLAVILSANVGDKPVEVLFDIEPALPQLLLGDAMRLQQVLINLGGNAIKFTNQGEVVLSVALLARADATVTLEFAVRDTGIGIAPENQLRIFSGFTQAEASTTRRFGGTGLGVAISQRLVAMMGGELRVDSALGQGSRFHFRISLPLVDGSGIVADFEPARRVAPAAAALHALVVDDNPSARDVLKRMGESLGWTVDTADSGEAALHLLQAQAAAGRACQAVFVDWQMPGLDGWATSQRIRALGLGGKPPVVVMVTAHGREMLAQRSPAEQALLDGFLVKPVTASMLFDAVVDAGRADEPLQPSRAPGAPSRQRLPALRLLVVEDNPNNQQVARELLEDEGALVQIASHGQEAVEAVAAADPPFDVVLMDLQMPVMDGFAATHCIRHDLGQERLPIVAMTANALDSDRAACLAAGMNDHVGKPFDLDHLVAVLCRWAGRPLVPALAPHAANPALGLVQPVAEAAVAAGVEVDAAVARLGGKVEVYRRMLGGFLAELDSWPAQLRACAVRGDAASAANLLHSLKGVAATLGANRLAMLAHQGEKQLIAGRAATELGSVVLQTCEAIAAQRSGLQALLQALPARSEPQAPGEPIEPAALRTALIDLAELLRHSDMAALDALAGLQQRFGAALGGRLQPLDEAVTRLDFEPALAHCSALIENLDA